MKIVDYIIDAYEKTLRDSEDSDVITDLASLQKAIEWRRTLDALHDVDKEIKCGGMKMIYMPVNPDIAKEMLKYNTTNCRKINKGFVEAYAADMRAGLWTSKTGTAISFSKDGKLLDGQHRLNAVIAAGVTVWMWVCFGGADNGLYDIGRRRTHSVSSKILRPDLEPIYTSERFAAFARIMITKGAHRLVTTAEITDYVTKHKERLGRFFADVPVINMGKLKSGVITAAEYLAYLHGVDHNQINEFNSVLISGMATREEHFPVVAYRNYLFTIKHNLNTKGHRFGELARCQYAIKKFITGSKTGRSLEPKELIYGFDGIDE